MDGDIIRLCGHEGLLTAKADLSSRSPATSSHNHDGVGRELFAMMRHAADGAERGASAMLALAGL